MLDICSLSVRYRGITALQDVCLTLHPGELVGLVGPNGAGKSSLLKAILGLNAAVGQVSYAGQPIVTQRQRLAYVPQRSQIDWYYPISAKNVVLMAQTQQMGWWRGFNRQAKAAVQMAMERLDVWHLRDRQIGELSGGQQQRVFLARALAQNAEVFLLDEPLAGVDRKTELIIREVLVELRSAGNLVIVCTHEWGEALRHYDRLVLIDQHIIANGSPETVMTPDNLRVAYGRGLRVVGCTHPGDRSYPKTPETSAIPSGNTPSSTALSSTKLSKKNTLKAL